MAHSTNSDASEPSTLEVGLSALKAKDYQKAITCLQPIVETQADQPMGVQAAMGLVVAYQQVGQVSPAISLCRTLAQNPNPQVKAWASKTLKQLMKRYPPPLSPPKTVATPEPGLAPAATSPLPPTGFVPLDKSPKSTPSETPAPPPDPVANLAPTTATIDQPDPLQWRQAGRLNGGRRLPTPHIIQFWIEQGITLIAFLWFTTLVLRFSLLSVNTLLLKLPFLRPIPLFYQKPDGLVWVMAVVLWISSPWLLDGFLTFFYGLKKLPTSKLLKISPEANKAIRQICQKRGWSAPTLKLLPLEVPVILSYGCWPRFARIVVSQGLLEQLAEDEIAALYAQQMGHLVHWDLPLMSLTTLFLLIPYTIYEQTAEGIQWLTVQSRRKLPQWVPGFVQSGFPYLVLGLTGIATLITTLSYGYFWLCRWPLFWISRRRVQFSDRFAAEITGNPNGLARALVKMTIGMAADLETQKATRHFWESMALLIPISLQQGLFVGSGIHHQPLTSLLAWDCLNPYRHWLVINQTHPLFGERLQQLGIIAQKWQLEREFEFPSAEEVPAPRSLKLRHLLLQGAPFLGIPVGLLVTGILWGIGGILDRAGIWQMDWLWADQALLQGCLLLGFGLGTLLRINHFFPDIKPKTAAGNSDLTTLLSDPYCLPVNSRPVQLQGQLLGRSGLSNSLGQDLVLQTSTGFVKLHDCGQLGPLSLLWPPATHARAWVGQQVTVLGWWRRGATPWVDLEVIRSTPSKIGRGDHPIWSTVVAFATAIWGVYIISKGGL